MSGALSHGLLEEEDGGCAELKAGLEADETEFVALDAGKIIREAKARREADDHSA